jgi:coenzyme F420 biosynthesis associated uncharacterized protein
MTLRRRPPVVRRVPKDRDQGRSRRAMQVGLAIGAGLAARYLAQRAHRIAARGLVDWDRVEQIATSRLRRVPGTLDPSELRASQAAYDRHMRRIVPLLEERLGVPLPGVVDRHDVVDRAGWARANMSTFQHLVDRLERHLVEPSRDESLATGVAALANRFLTTQQVGFVLAYLGSRVLGQYDVALLSAEQAPGRLLFVEENIRATAATLGVPLDDFRMWIALHEATHAYEMEAHPWVRPYLADRLERQIAGFLEDARTLQTRGFGHLLRRWRASPGEGPLAGLLSAEQRALFRETQLLMSLLEGFSDWVMDEVGAKVVDDVAGIRERFEARRNQRRRGLDRVIARLTGLDVKLEQYRRGERFVSGVATIGGAAAAELIWDGPQNLPTAAEFEDPAAWVRRVVGSAA